MTKARLKARLKDTGEKVTPLPVDFGGPEEEEEEKVEAEGKSGKRRRGRSRSASRDSEEVSEEEAKAEAKSLPPDQTFVLQNFFDDKSKNPKDDDIRYLSKALYLDQKVVAAWFRMARRQSRDSK